MAYDAMGNYTGYDEDTSAEEELKRKKELANTPVHTQESTVYGDGTHEQTTTITTPPQAQPAYQAPPVAKTLTPGEQVVQATQAQPVYQAPAPAAQPVAQAQPVAPVVPNQQQYNANMAQAESNNNPNIGYHDQSKSSAYGTYGITAPAYQDARKLNPTLPADITQATPEQQNQAMNAVTANNARYLKAYGIEPTQQNLSAAHFSGASGLNDFFTKKDDQGRPYISPAAQAANGGYDKARSIIESRLGGQVAPASGALNQPQAQAQQQTVAAPVNPAEPSPYSLSTGNTGQGLQAPGQQAQPAPVAEHPSTPFINAYQTAQDDPAKLLQLRNDPNAPKFIQDRASQRAYDLMHRDMSMNTAKQEVTQNATAAMAGDNKAQRWLADTMKSPTATFAKMILAGFLSPQLAGEYAKDLGFGSKTEVTDVGGKPAQVTMDARGNVTGGHYFDGTPLKADELGQASTGFMPQGVHITKVTNKIDPKSGVEVTEQTLSNGRTRFMQGGAPYRGDVSGLTEADEYNRALDRKVASATSNLNKITNTPTEQQKYEALRKAGVPARRIEEEMAMAPGSLTNQTMTAPVANNAPQSNATVKPAVAAEPTTSEPVQRPGEANATFQTRLKDWQHKNQLQEKDAEAFVGKKVDIKSTLDRLKNAVDIIDSGDHHLGPQLQGTGTLPGVQQAVGSLYGSQASQNTNEINSLISRAGLEGIKNYMGPAISNFDVQTWMKNNPISERSSPEAIKAWLVRTHNAMLDSAETQRKNAVNHGMLEPGFTLGNRLETGKAAGATSDVRKRADAIIGQ
jgi:hypothetical protein